MSFQRVSVEPAQQTVVMTPPIRPGRHSRLEDIVAWDNWWRSGADRALAVLAATGEPFTADELHSDHFGLPDPRHPNHLGALFSAARTRGLIEHVGWKSSANPTRRGGAVRIWRGRPAVTSPTD